MLCLPPLGPSGAFSSLSFDLGPRRVAALVTALVLVGSVVESVGRGLAFWKSNTNCQLKLFQEMGTYGSVELARTGFAASSPPADSASTEAP